MLVVRVSPKDGLYREIDVPGWNAEDEQEWRNGKPITEFAYLDADQRLYIQYGEVPAVVDPIPVDATEPAPKRKAKAEKVEEPVAEEAPVEAVAEPVAETPTEEVAPSASNSN